jgi:hypothetical protein
MAMTETLQSRVSPMTPAVRIPKGPEYSHAFTLRSFLGRGGETLGAGRVVLAICLGLVRHALYGHYLIIRAKTSTGWLQTLMREIDSFSYCAIDPLVLLPIVTIRCERPNRPDLGTVKNDLRRIY